MRRILDAILWVFLAPGEWLSDRMGVTHEENRELARMLINSLFWIVVAIIGLALWTNNLPMYQ